MRASFPYAASFFNFPLISSGYSAAAAHVFAPDSAAPTISVTVFLNQVILRGGLLFEVRLPTARAETLALIERIENGTAEMVGPFKTFEEYKSWVTSDDEDEV